MEKILIDSIKKLKTYLNDIDIEINKNISEPDNLELYIKTRSSVLLEIIQLNKELSRVNTWKEYRIKKVGSITSQKGTYLG